jgi:lysophospholipase L1-like esterase
LGWRGKPVFGDPASRKLKIMVLGDSYTDGVGISEKNMYYGVIRESLDAEMFVYGGIGYGTLQEYMVMDKHIDAVRPEVILLQVCANDFINNQWELESASYFNNNLMMRPYLVDDSIVRRFPGFGGSLLWFLAANSRVVDFLHLSGERALASFAKRGVLRTVEADIAAQGVRFDGFRRAVETTRRIVAKMKRRAGNIPIVAFPVDEIEPYLGEFDRLFRAESIEFISDVPKAIAAQEARGSNLRIDGSHWNGEGHRVCGRLLAAALASRIPRLGTRVMLHSR